MTLTFALAVASGCGDDDASPPDGSTGPRATLEIVDPPGDVIGLAFGEHGTLSVRLVDADHDPLAAEVVEFAIDPGTNAGGSSLSSTAVATDEDGMASVTVVAGAAHANFQVDATAEGAAPATFYVAVTDQGFASLSVTPRHLGDRPAGQFTAVEVRLYPGRICATADPSDPPESLYPPRTAPGFDVAVPYQAIGGNEPYTILSWGHDGGPHVLAAGCVELDEGQVRAGSTIGLDVPVADRAPGLAPVYTLQTLLELGPVADTALAIDPAWTTAACPFGGAQALLDVAVPQMADGDPAKAALEAARAPLDGSGCRVDDTGLSVEAALDIALRPGPSAPDLATAASLIRPTLSELYLASELHAENATAWHRLLRAVVQVPGRPPYLDELLASSRPVVEVHGIAISLSGAGVLLLGEHGFTLRAGTSFRNGFAAQALEPNGFPPDPAGIGSALLAAASTPSGATGCDAASEAACTAAGQAIDCLTSACQTAVPLLDAAFATPFAWFDTVDLDLHWQGVATATDADLDLAVETLDNGLWSAELRVADGTWTPVTGEFSGLP